MYVGLSVPVGAGLLKESSLIDPFGHPYIYVCDLPDCSEASISAIAGSAPRAPAVKIRLKDMSK
jgi:hypothetical protein